MKVVEKDKLIYGMLKEEFERCKNMVISLEQALSNLPKGKLNVRKKQYKKKSYSYHYLKFREGNKSISKHIPENQVEALKKKLLARKNYEKEIKSYKVRMSYLEKILKERKR